MSKEFNEWFEKEYPQHSPDCDCDDCNKQISWEDMEKAFRGGQESVSQIRYDRLIERLEKENRELREQVKKLTSKHIIAGSRAVIESILKEGGE